MSDNVRKAEMLSGFADHHHHQCVTGGLARVKVDRQTPYCWWDIMSHNALRLNGLQRFNTGKGGTNMWSRPCWEEEESVVPTEAR